MVTVQKTGACFSGRGRKTLHSKKDYDKMRLFQNFSFGTATFKKCSFARL
jgi:hypothetical protein